MALHVNIRVSENRYGEVTGMVWEKWLAAPYPHHSQGEVPLWRFWKDGGDTMEESQLIAESDVLAAVDAAEIKVPFEIGMKIEADHVPGVAKKFFIEGVNEVVDLNGTTTVKLRPNTGDAEYWLLQWTVTRWIFQRNARVVA